jgi:type II secretory pathway component GspD/PulD (secretin)
MYFQRVDGGFPTLSRQLTAFEVTLDFLMKNNRADILTNSQVVTLNGHEATISMVDVVPYILSSGGIGGQVQVQREEIGIKLHILPTVNTDGYITTTVRPEVSSIFEFIGPDRNIPWVKKRQSSTTIRVMDNESIIIGGLISLDKKKVEHRIPLLSKIPYIGERFFKHTSEIETKTDLVIQITPKIIYDSYSGIDKNQFHIETENEAATYKQNLEQENKEK